MEGFKLTEASSLISRGSPHTKGATKRTLTHKGCYKKSSKRTIYKGHDTMLKKMLFLLIFTTSIHAQNNEEFFNAEDLKPGMKGYALTVFQGTEPEKMDLEVIAYMPNRLTKAGFILVRLSGANVERTRVAAGMSGSPVYIEGKLVGALAYTWANARELLAGIVPIQDMISDKERASYTSFAPPQSTPIQTSWAIQGIDNDELLKALQDTTPLTAPIRGTEEFITIPSSRTNGVAPLKGGDAVAIKLMEGDINIASIGTVTYVDGEDVYIYGHPMDSAGPVSLPLSKATIYDIMASTELSFKLGAALPETIGSTMFDGMSSVYGRFDKQALMIPVAINIKGKNYSNSYHFNIARSRRYLPVLLGVGIGAVLERELGSNIEKKINLSWNLEFTNDQVINNEVTWVKNTYYRPGSIQDYWENYLSILWENELVQLIPEKLTFDLTIEDEVYDYYIVNGLKSSRDTYFAGESVDLQVSFQKYLTDISYTNINIPLSKSLIEGTYTLLVGSALEIETSLIDQFYDYYAIRTEDQLLNELKKPINSNQLIAVLIDSRTGSIAGNTFLGNFPESRRSLFESIDYEGKDLLSPKLIETKYEMSDPVIGSRSLTITVVNPEPITD